MSTSKIVVSTVGAAVVASLIVLLVGWCAFGFQFAEWTEQQGGIVGLLGTIAGLLGAAIGLWIALRADRRATK